MLEARSGQRWSCALLHVECVKAYAPRIFHVVFDVEFRPQKNQ